MFERLSEKAMRVIFWARQEASAFGSPAIDTEHLLFGVLRESPKHLGFIALSTAVQTIGDRLRQQGSAGRKIPETVELPFSEKAKNVLQRSSQEADQLEIKTIMTKHILYALLLEDNSLAQQSLAEWGVTSDMVR